MGDVWTAIGAIGALVAAGAACFAGYFTYRIMQSAQAQIKVSQEQNLLGLEAERDAQLPVLILLAPLASAGYAKPDGLGGQAQEVVAGYDRNQPFVRVTVKNAGAGIALNIWGIVFEPTPTSETQRLTGQHHSHRYDLPLEPGDTKLVDWSGGGVAVSGDAEMGDGTRHFSLYAPSKPAFADVLHGETEKIARLTLTYRDIFGRRHVAIYDLTAQMEWENVAFLRNVPQDLGEMERAALQQRSPLASPWLPTPTSRTGV